MLLARSPLKAEYAILSNEAKIVERCESAVSENLVIPGPGPESRRMSPIRRYLMPTLLILKQQPAIVRIAWSSLLEPHLICAVVKSLSRGRSLEIPSLLTLIELRG